MHRQRRILALLLFAALLFASARAESPPARTPDDVRLRINAILSHDDEAAPPFAETVNHDDAGGFAFCSLDGERNLEGDHTYAFIRGQMDENERMSELSIILRPSKGFSRDYCLESDRFCRVFLLSVFDSLTEAELALLMDSYRYDIRPYRYKEGDTAVAERACMCEIELNSEFARIDSESAPGDVISLRISFLHDADEATRSRAAENAWRIRRLSIAVSECEMIRTCGDCLDGLDAQNSADEVEALLALALQSAEAVCAMESEYMHAQEVFLTDLQNMCTQLQVQIGACRAAYALGDIAAAEAALQKIRFLCTEIDSLPETLY